MTMELVERKIKVSDEAKAIMPFRSRISKAPNVRSLRRRYLLSLRW
jgi:hypothetical protein